MSKKIDGKKFKIAVKSLNDVLVADKAEKIKVVGVKKEEVLESFTTSVQGYIDNDKVSDLPDEVIDFYNEFIADDSADDSAEEEKEKAPKEGKKKKEKKEKKEKAPSTKITRETSIGLVLKGRKSITIEDLIEKSDDLYVKKGGTSNKSQAERGIKRMIKYLVPMEIITVEGEKIIVSQ